MERSPAVVWTCLLGVGLILAFSDATSQTAPQPPQLTRCEFHNRANVTCYWEPGDAPVTRYTLTVERVPWMGQSTNLHMFTCTTSNTSCTAVTNSSVRFTFCITVTAHGHNRDVSSERRCRSGRDEVRLPPVDLSSVEPVTLRPDCLNVTWSHTLSVFPVSHSEIKARYLRTQVELAAQGQLDVQVRNITVADHSVLVCLFRPDVSYTVRLRHSYRGPESPWSQWSNSCQGRTAEGAPSAASTFWRRVEETEESGWRLISLLWKPLPHFLANGRVRFYNVTCQTENGELLRDHAHCRDVRNTSTSCSLHVPAGRCSCALTASTSAGTSPGARIWLLGSSETEPPPPREVTATPLGDGKVEVGWKAPADPSTSSFVVEWSAVRERNSSVLYWKQLNSSCTGLVITEGVKPMERYVISVTALYGERGTGQYETVLYTREGAPSGGPDMRVHQIYGSTVKLRWSPVPVEQLRGFLRNYTITYSTAQQPARRVFVPANVQHYSLMNLLPGEYKLFMQANTNAGPGERGPEAWMLISEEIPVLMYTLLPLLLMSLVLVLMVCLANSNMVKKKLRQHIPNPSNSSVAHWTPKMAVENIKWPAEAERTEVKYSEVILLGEGGLQTPDEDVAYQSLLNPQSYFPHLYSPPQNTWKSQQFLKTLGGHPSPLVCSSFQQSHGWQERTVSVSDVQLQPGGASEPRGATKSESPLSQKNLHYFLKQCQSPVSLSDFTFISHSSVLFPHPPEVAPPQHPFSKSLHNSVPSLQADAYIRPDALSDTLTPFPQSVFVDFSYCPLECISDPV